MSDPVIQRGYRFNEALLECYGIHNNGCNYRLLIDIDNDKTYLTYGCMGIFINLVQGVHKNFYKWFESNKDDDGRVDITDIIHPMTLNNIHKHRYCNMCSGTRYLTKHTDPNPYINQFVKRLKEQVNNA